MPSPLAIRFFTFYSFKGGVGRSMALLNCAYVLAGQGRCVLMIDFDLEAPGRSFLIQRREAKKKSATKKKDGAQAKKVFEQGLVELIGAFIQDPEGWPLAQAECVQLSEQHGLKGLRAVGQAELALVLAKAGDSAEAVRLARAAIQFFDSQHVRHPRRNDLEAVLIANAWK